MKEACYTVFAGMTPAFYLHWIQKYCVYTEAANSFNCNKRIWCLAYLASQKNPILTERWMIPNSWKIPNGIFAAFALMLLCSWGVGLEREQNFCLLLVLSSTFMMHFFFQALFSILKLKCRSLSAQVGTGIVNFISLTG